MKRFKKAFALDRIEEQVSKIVKDRQQIQFSPSEGKYQFTPEFYKSHFDAMDDFETRHGTIKDEIDTSETIGLKLEDFLQNQIILDFHFRGEQDVFEAEYEQLIDKAERLLGAELYTQLSHCIGEPLHVKAPELYDRLWQVYERVESKANEKLSQHQIQLKQFKTSEE